MNDSTAYNLFLSPAAAKAAAMNDAHFSELPHVAQKKFHRTLAVAEMLLSRMKGGASLSAAAREVAPRFAMTPRNAEKLFRRIQDSNGHWSAFLDRRYISRMWDKNGRDSSAKLPKPFIEYWVSLCLENQRCNRQAWMKLLRNLEAWRAGIGAAIPGYGFPPENSGNCNYPKGWSYANLTRFAPEKFELAAVRQGRGAASQTLPCVRTSRADSYFFGELLFDDMWHDFMVSGIGNRPGAVRLLEFGAIDFNSGYYIPPLIKPRIIDAGDGTMKNLNTRDFRFYLAGVLTQYGYNPRGTILTVEHGTAAISAELESFLKFASNGAISVNRGGISGRGAYIGAYSERGKGNPRAKALKEGAGKLIHNFFATLPGQVGTGVEKRPAELWGRLKEFGALAKIIHKLPENRRADLRLGILPYDVAEEILFEGYRIINGRTEHNFEGWEECGYTLTEVKFPGGSEWVALEKALHGMDARQAEMFRALAAGNAELTRTRRLSPQEVYNARKCELVRLPEHLTPQIVGLEYASKRSPRRMVFEFRDREIEPNALLRYEAKAETPGGESVQLYDGDDYLTFVNPFNPARMFVLKPDGGYIGFCKRWAIPARSDRDAVLRDFGRIQGMYGEQIRRVNRLKGEPQIMERTDRSAHNAEILSAVGASKVLPCEADEGGSAPFGFDDSEGLGTPTFEDFIPEGNDYEQ